MTSGANAIESDFGTGNTFSMNTCEYANFGMWLGYSHLDISVFDNYIAHNRWAGIAVDHGQNFEIIGNHLVT